MAEVAVQNSKGELRDEISSLPKRAQYWLWRLGFFTGEAKGAAGTLGLPAKTRMQMLRAIQEYGASGAANKMSSDLVDKLKVKMTSVVQENESVISSLRLAETEVAMFKKLLPEIEQSKSMSLQFGPEHVE